MGNSKILSIIPKRNKKNIYKVTSSNGKTIEISKEILQSNSLFEGMELKDSAFEKIVFSENYFRAKEAGLILLSYRMRSKKELRTRLIKKGFSIDVINDIILEFEKKDWINDKKFGLAFSRDQINRNYIGPIALKYKLKEYIESLELIDQISNIIYSELGVENIISKIFQKYPPHKIDSDYNLKRKVINKLKRKGHYWQDIDKALTKYTSC